MPDKSSLPRYKCHKEVRASKILKIGAVQSEHWTTLTLEHAPILVPESYMRKHEPSVGGYYVLYEDGYESFSPVEAFEAGYTLIQ